MLSKFIAAFVMIFVIIFLATQMEEGMKQGFAESNSTSTLIPEVINWTSEILILMAIFTAAFFILPDLWNMFREGQIDHDNRQDLVGWSVQDDEETSENKQKPTHIKRSSDLEIDEREFN